MDIVQVIRSSDAHRRFVTPKSTEKEIAMWTKPEVTEMRFGFEVTMYVCNR